MKKITYNNLHSRLILTLIPFLWLLLTGCGQENAQNDSDIIDIESHKVRGETYIERGQFRPAMIEAQNIIQKQPDDSMGYVLLAEIYNHLGQGRSATQILENENIVNKNNDYWITLAESYHLRSKYQSSADLLDKHSQIADTHQQEYLLLKAKNFLNLGDPENAKGALEKLLSDDPDNIDAQLEVTKIALIEDLQAGQETLAQLVAKAPDNPKVLLLKARSAYAQGDIEQTEDILNETLAVLPSTDLMTPIRIQTLETLSSLLVRQGRTNEALVYTRLLSEAFPGANELKAKYEQAITLYKEGKLDESETALKELLQEAPNHEMASQLLAIIHYLQGNFEESAAQFSDKLDPETASLAAKHAFALSNMRLNKPEKVLEVLSIDIDKTDNPDTLSLYGAAALSSTASEAKKGLKALRKALELDNKRTRIHLLLANYYNRQLPPDYPKALAELQQAYAATPEDTDIKTNLLRQLFVMGEIKQATTIIKKILTSQPNEASSQLLAAHFYFNLEDYGKAQQYYAATLKIDDESVAGFVGLIETAIKLQQWRKAEKNSLELIEKFPDQRPGYQLLSKTYQAQGKPEEMVTKLKVMTDEDNNSVAAGLLASNYANNGDFEEARKYEKIAVSLNPDNEMIEQLSVSITIQEALRYQREKNYTKALETALAGLNKSPDDPRLITILVQTEVYNENYDEAEKIIQQTAANNAYLATQLNGDLSRVRGQNDQALQYYNEAWEMDPSEQIALKILTLLKSQKQEKQADKFLVTWLERFPNSANALTFQSDAHLAKGNYKKAISALEKIIEARPNSAVTLNNLAWSYFKVNHPKAEATAKKAYEIAPENGAIADTYGWILYNKGKKAEAIAVLKRAVELLPDNEEIQQHLTTAMGDKAK